MTAPVPASSSERALADPIHVVTVVMVVLVVGLAVAVGWFPRIAVPDHGSAEVGYISRLYDPPTRSVEVALDIGDGQIFATQAVDPLASDPDVIRGGREEQAYRYQRGAYGWVGWVASAGRADAVPWALVAVTGLSVALLVGVVAEVIRRQGGPPLVALVLLATPGVITDLLFIGPEALGTALVVAGAARWCRRPGAWGAVGLFAAAGLCRESLLLVPAALALVALAERRPAQLLRLAVSAVPYVAWVGFLRVRIGAWPVGSTEGRLSFVPFGGMATEAWRWGSDDAAGLLLVAVLGVAGLLRARDRGLRAILGAHVAFAALLGPAVWTEAAHAGRVLLPMCALPLVAIARPGGAARGDPPSPEERHVGRSGRPGAPRTTPETFRPPVEVRREANSRSWGWRARYHGCSCPILSSSAGPASTTSGASTSICPATA